MLVTLTSYAHIESVKPKPVSHLAKLLQCIWGKKELKSKKKEADVHHQHFIVFIYSP